MPHVALETKEALMGDVENACGIADQRSTDGGCGECLLWYCRPEALIGDVENACGIADQRGTDGGCGKCMWHCRPNRH